MNYQMVHCFGCNKAIKRCNALVKRNKTGLWFCSNPCKYKYYKIKNTVHCDYCKKPYLARNGMKSMKGNYCSKECKSMHQGSCTIVVCSYCRQTFKRASTHANRVKNNFCNTSCMGNWQKEHTRGKNSPSWQGKNTIVPCDSCGRDLVRPYWQRVNNSHNFCNHKCFGDWKSRNWVGESNPAWVGGHTPYYGPNWKRQARRARTRDNHTCRSCGTSEQVLGQALDVHHIVRFGDFTDYKKANLLTNLISLCHPCHMKVEYSKLPLPE